MVLLHPNLALPATFYKGQRPIDGFFVTLEVTPLAGAYLSKEVMVWEHIVMVLYIPIRI